MSSASDSRETARVEIDTADDRGRLRRMWDTLQDTIGQTAETVTRSASLKTASGNVEDIDPPEDIDEFVDLYYEIGLIRKNLGDFVDDVTEPGLRVSSPDDATQDYFMGGDAAPEGAPENGFLSECFLFDERRQPFRKGLTKSVRDRWVRGTVLVEYLKADPEESESIITGFKFVRPETVSARTYENSTQLIDPDDTENADITTKRDEAAAFVQFDEKSVLGRRLGTDLFTSDDTSIPLSQNDVLKMTLDQDIGGEDAEDGVFGVSVIRAIKDDAEEYRSIKRDLTEIIKGKAGGLWTLQMTPEVLDYGDRVEVIEWDDDAISDMEDEVDDIGPGDALTADAPIDLKRHDGEVPALEWALKHYARDIIDPLPAPFYKHAQADEINQFVTDDQQEDYQDRIASERAFQSEQWQIAFREVARRHPDLESDELTVTIEPRDDESPIRSLDDETIDKIATFADALDKLSGQSDPVAIWGREALRELVLMLPAEEDLEDTLEADALDEGDEQVQRQFDRIMNGQ